MFNTLPAPLDIAGLDSKRVAPFGGWDVYQDTFYSTLVVPQAGQPVNQPLVFFAGNEVGGIGDRSLTNVSAQNALIPGGHKFHAQRLYFVPIIETFVAGAGVIDASGLARDLDRVFKTNRPTFTYTSTKLNKNRGQIPLDAVGEMGGIMPDFGGNNVPAAGNNAVYQHGRLAPLGGWPIDLVVYENEGITVSVSWGVLTALQAAMTLRAVLMGWHYVQVG